jgi:hypothetical protein
MDHYQVKTTIQGYAMNTNGMKKIGNGAFSTVYKKSRSKVLIKSRDNVKECMALGWFPETSLFPRIERVGMSDCGEWQFYEEKYYPRVKSLKNTLSAFEWEFYQELRKLHCSFLHPYELIDKWRKQFESLPNKFHHKKRMLLEAVDGLSNYGCDICFEISPRNVATQGKKLVLLDCFFMKSQLLK